jgi:3-oxoacyl-ACP reductase-like protein
VRARSVALNALRDLGNAHGHLVQDIKKLRTETEEPPSFLPPRVVVPAPAPAPAPVPVAAPALPAPVIPAVPDVPRLSVPELFQVLESTYQLALKTSARCEALNQGVSSYVRGTKRKLPFRLGEEGLV